MQPLILWIHALAALLFAVLAMAQAQRTPAGLPRAPLVAALATTALWALAVAGIGFADIATRLAEGLRQLAWLGFMAMLTAAGGRARLPRQVGALYIAVAGVTIGAMVLAVVATLDPFLADAALLAQARLGMRTMAAIAALILVRHLDLARPQLPGAARLVVLALAAIWALDLVLYATTWITGRWPDALITARGLALIALVPVLMVATQRGVGTLQVSRTVAFQSLTVAAIVIYVALVGVATTLVGDLGGEHARIAQAALVFGSAAALLTLASTPWLRAWSKVIVAKHLFAHRYDYRTEWLGFTDTLAADVAMPLDRRVVKAVADLTDSPAGLLLVPDGDGLGVAADWNWRDIGDARADAALVRHLAASRRIVELDAVRGGRVEAGEAAAVPAWIIAQAEAWAIVPLLHAGRLTGAIVLTRPPVDRALDWEDFDLLGVAGRQAASYLAEDRAHAALAEAQRFDEFNRRFAFILHDLKNMVSQLTLVARNAERHAENPEFRADMIATLRESSDRMTALLARLANQGPREREAARAVPVAALLQRIALARRAQHDVRVVGDATIAATAEPAALETLLGHLVQNAIEASLDGAPITLLVGLVGDVVTIDVIDRGTGMSPAFVRDRLFKPFDSSKPGGFGIGAFEARKLAEAMGGTVEVASREGEGTRFRITLRAAAIEKEAA